MSDLTHIYDRLGESNREYYRGMEKMNDKLNNELAHMLYKQAPIVSVSLYAMLAVAIYFFWGVMPHHFLLLWVGANFTFSSLLLLLYWSYRVRANVHDDEWWIKAYTYHIFLQESAWGLIGPLSFLIDNEVYRLLTMFMLGGMAAGSIATRGVIFKTYAISVIFLLLPTLITLMLQNDPVSEGMLALTVVYMFFMLSVARVYSASIRKSILLWLDNGSLISELRSSKEETEQVNHGLINEIERRKLVESELYMAKERAERASEAKNQFLANVSHELRTPLNGIIGFSTILGKSKLTEEQSGFLRQIDRSANSLLRNVNDILDITAIEAGHLKLFEQPFSLLTEIEDVITLMQPQAAQKGLRLENKLDGDVTDILTGDANRLRQIITNILSNAIKYTESGFVELRVQCVKSDYPNITLQFDIEDSGIGIPATSLARVFDSFTQVENFNRKRVDGVGLGLSIVKSLLNEMGGRIWVDSTPGKGTTFSFELPFTAGTENFSQQEKFAEYSPAQLESLKRLLVLIVDDNEVNRMVLAAFLRQHGISYYEASGGQEALNMMHVHEFDTVLLDIQMPDFTGIEVAQQVTQMDGLHPSLIAVTAHAFPEQREEIIAAGFSDFLVKPISEEGLLHVLNSVNHSLQGEALEHQASTC